MIFRRFGDYRYCTSNYSTADYQPPIRKFIKSIRHISGVQNLFILQEILFQSEHYQQMLRLMYNANDALLTYPSRSDNWRWPVFTT